MGCICGRITPLLTSVCALLLLAACDGTLLDAPGSTPASKRPSVGSTGQPADPTLPVEPGTPTRPTNPSLPVEPTTPTNPELPVVDPFASASIGSRCLPGRLGQFLVLGGPSGACADHAATFTSPSAAPPFAWAELPDVVPIDTDLVLEATVCLQAGACAPRSLTVRLEAYTEGQLARGRWSMALEGARGEGSFSASGCTYQESAEAGLSRAAIIQEVALYQAVRVPIARDTQALTAHNAPVVEDREALVRVFVSPRPGAAVEEVVARLTLESIARGPVVLESTMTVTRVSSETSADSTFNFIVPRDTLKSDTRFAVSLHGTSVCSASEDVVGARVPTTGTASLDVQSPRGSFEVVLVPIRYEADGSSRLPDTSSDQIARYRDRIYSMFPVSNVNITVRDAVGWDGTLARNGSGWSNLLQAVMNLRGTDQAPAHVYYYGIFAPATSLNNFCNGGCVSGLGSVPPPNDTYTRAGIGLGFSGASSADTAAHELGHTLGRQHAPCGLQDADPQFPYANGGIGVWGFNVLSNTLVAPNQNSDFMGYCNPAWVSDYTFSSMFQRIEYVNRNRGTQNAGVFESYRVAISDMDGLRWGEPVTLLRAPAGETIRAKIMGLDGKVVEQSIIRYPLADIDGAFFMVPSASLPSGARLELPEGGLSAL